MSASSVPNVQEVDREVEGGGRAGGTGRTGADGSGVRQTPDGLRIEILENKDSDVPDSPATTSTSMCPNREIPKIQAWYAAFFGAKPGKRGAQHRRRSSWRESVVHARRTRRTVTTKGRVLDHIGFDVKNLEAFTKKLEAAGRQDRASLHDERGGGHRAGVHHRSVGHVDRAERAAGHAIADDRGAVSRRRLVLASCVIAASISSARAQTPPTGAEAILRSPAFVAASDFIARDYDRFVRELVTLTEIPAPALQGNGPRGGIPPDVARIRPRGRRNGR